MYGASSHAKPKVCSGEQVIDVLDTAFGEAIITLLMIREQTDRVIINWIDLSSICEQEYMGGFHLCLIDACCTWIGRI